MDRVCIDPNAKYCAPLIEFFTFNSQFGLDYVDGILGLAPDSSGGVPSFISSLKNNQVIDNRVFSVYIGQGTEQSMIQFGGYDSFKVKKDQENEGYGIHWYNLESEYSWLVDIYGI